MNTLTTSDLLFAPVNGKKVSARFDDPQVSSDGGALFLREVDRQIGLSERLATAIADGRRNTSWACVKHPDGLEHNIDSAVAVPRALKIREAGRSCALMLSRSPRNPSGSANLRFPSCPDRKSTAVGRLMNYSG